MRDWSKPEFDDPGVSDAVITSYEPAADDESGDGFYVRWHGEISGPNPAERNPYFAQPLADDFPTIEAARAAVEKEYKKRKKNRR